MQQFLRIFIDIVLWRRGPQDLPASGLLLAITLAAYVLVGVVQLALLDEPGATWLVYLLADPVLLALFVWLLLRLYGHAERFQQTATAVLGTGALLGVALVPAAADPGNRLRARPGLAGCAGVGTFPCHSVRARHRAHSQARDGCEPVHRHCRLTHVLHRHQRAGRRGAGHGQLNMHLHIVGICGTFMGGIAALARASGHRVTGSDRSVYPPMSTQLASLGIDVIEGYGADQLSLDPDVFVIGNVMSRGNPLVEAILDSGRRYESGPEWLARNVLAGRWVLGVAGTHGKTTTSSLLASIMQHAGLEPGFLVGGVPLDFDVSARLGGGSHFVVEADEYDTAFFDKRAKFVHYRPRTAILNNLEHDHADIYPDVASIQRQFHLLLRTIPGNGCIVMNGADRNLDQVIEMGCWTPVQRFTSQASSTADWRVDADPASAWARFSVHYAGRHVGDVEWGLLGRHNAENGLAALAAAHHAGVEVAGRHRGVEPFPRRATTTGGEGHGGRRGRL